VETLVIHGLHDHLTSKLNEPRKAFQNVMSVQFNYKMKYG